VDKGNFILSQPFFLKRIFFKNYLGPLTIGRVHHTLAGQQQQKLALTTSGSSFAACEVELLYWLVFQKAKNICTPVLKNSYQIKH
jgi:hypothetical protein